MGSNPILSANQKHDTGLCTARAFLFATMMDNEQGYLRNFVAPVVAQAPPNPSVCDFGCEMYGHIWTHRFGR